MENTENTIDYTDEYNRRSSTDYIRVHGLGFNVLFLSILSCPRKRFDGKMAYYGLDVRFLSSECSHYKDEAWACCTGQDYILLTKKEALSALKTDSLFLSFSLVV